MAFAGRTERVIVTGLVVCLAIAGLVAYSLRAKGYTARHVDLNDGGIWVSSDHDGLFGRANLPVGSLDAAISPPDQQSGQNPQLSIVQDAAGVVARDLSAGKLYPVNGSTGEILSDSGITVSSDAEVAIGGGTVAVLDPNIGKVWAARFDPATGVSSLTALGEKSPAVATLGGSDTTGRQTALAVGSDGTVRALSEVKGKDRIAVVRPAGTSFAKVRYSGIDVNLSAPQITSVGDSTVVFDASTGQLVLPDGKIKSVPDSNPTARIQQSGPSSSHVFVATTANLYSVDLSSGTFTPVSAAGTGAPSPPVVVGDCLFAAWAGTPGAAVRGCGNDKPATITLQDQKILQNPVLQANRDSVALNDVVGGGVWDLSSGRRIDNWAQAQPPKVPKQKPKSNINSKTQGVVSAPPRAVDDVLGARPARTTILHLLDNDSDPAGRILTIASVSGLDNPDAHLDIAPDGQTVQIQMPSTGTAVHFSYLVNDNARLSDTARVTVNARPRPMNKAPHLRAMPAKVWTVPSGGKLSLPVIGDWRDDDGDPPVLADATTTGGRVSTTPDGRLDYIAPVDPGTQKIRYEVTDNIASTPAIVTINVLSKTSTATVAPIAESDVARGQVNKPIVIHPLDNDLPGADPTNPDAQLRIASRIPNPDGVTIDTDLQSGTVTVLATQQKDFVFTYTAAYGVASSARGSVRVNIDGAQSKTPIALLDTVSLHGQRPVTADVLSNDFDPAGGLLVVQHAEPVSSDPSRPDLQVAIIQGRYLRINALTPELAENPEVIEYTVTNGVQQATGQVSVSQQPEPASDVPVPQDDYAVVRAGDSTSVAVLDNDSAPSGDSLSLITNVTGAPGRGLLDARSTGGGPGQIGRAYVTNSVVRYVAPSSVRTETAVTVDYVVTNSGGDQATGHLYLTIEPPPSKSRPNQQPTPPEIDVRVVAGDTVTIPVRTTNSDPDGDAVTLVGIGQGTNLGRILGSTASSLRYQAYPSSTNAGTDTFSYIVTDKYGLTGKNNVRVAVVQPGDPQPPVASDISVTADAGRTVSVDALASVFRSPDDRVTLLPLKNNNSPVPGGARIRTTGVGPILVTAPSGAVPVELRYSVSSGLAAPSAATITVRSQKGVDLPPVAFDDYAAPAALGTIVTVDPVTRAYDPDSPEKPDVRLTAAFGPTAKIVAGKVAIEVTGQPQVVPYEITDAGGAVATASVFVPAAGAGAPYLKAGSQIAIDADATKVVTATSYAVDPAGKPLLLTSANLISASPASGIKVALSGTTGLTLTSLNHYTGPAAVTFQVTDGQNSSDPDGTTGVITVPVQVGPETPVLRCTASPLTTVQGGATLDIDVTSLCHVWVADARTLDTIQYTPSWQPGRQPDSVTLSGSGGKTLHLFAAGTSKPGQKGSLTVRVAGNDAVVPGVLNAVVVAAPRPTVQPVTLTGVRAGTSVSVNMANYTSSPLVDAQIGVVRSNPISQTARVTTNNMSIITVTPGADAKGTIVYEVVVSDTFSKSDVVSRQATGRLTIHVLGKPDAPTDVTPDRSLLSEQANLSWNAPANNGLPIDYYVVSWNGGSQRCAASPCTIRNLTNGQMYRFTVQAHNSIGNSKSSAQSAPVQPNAVPQAPTALRFSDPQDGKVTLSWTAAKVNGTPVTSYVISWPGHRKTTPSTTFPATGLDNASPTSFQIAARNSAGTGPSAPITAQSSGTPQFPAPPAAAARLPQPKVSGTQAGDHQAVLISWPAIDPNGPGPTHYVVTRMSGGNTVLLCNGTTDTSCTDRDVANDGNSTDYSYTAVNKTGHASQPSVAYSFVARGTPQGIKSVDAEATGRDNELQISFETNPVYDSSMTVKCVVQGSGFDCGSWQYSGGTSGASEPGKKINVGQDGPVTVVLTQYNSQGVASTTTGSKESAAYGRITSPTLANVTTSGPNVDFTVGYNTHGSPIDLRVIVTTRQHGSLGDFAGSPYLYDTTFHPSEQDSADHTLTFSDDGSPAVNGGAPGGAISIGSNMDAQITVFLSDGPANLPADKRGSGGNTRAEGSITQQPYTGQLAASVSRGSRADCPDKDNACGHVHVTITGFQKSGQVTCSFATPGGAALGPATVNTNRDGTFDNDLATTYNSGGAQVTMTCEGIQSPAYGWPG